MKTLLDYRSLLMAGLAATALASARVSADLQVDPCRPVIIVGPVEGVIPLDTMLYAHGQSS
ncbi:MAG TPA: hypothetical protein VGM03_19950, partial [Phycisphaerae bacterium]